MRRATTIGPCSYILLAVVTSLVALGCSSSAENNGMNTTAGASTGSGGSAGDTNVGGNGNAGSSSGGSTTGGDTNSGGGQSEGGETGNGGETGDGGETGEGGAGSTDDLEPFSFFVTSLAALVDLSGSESGFGGDLTYGEEGEGAGLRGADKICAAIAERSMPGSSAKQWRAFLSTTVGGEEGGPIHAIDRIGEGPWYDRLGRLFANSKDELLADRPTDADAEIINDFPNEDGVPNHNPDSTGEVDNHDMLTGTNDQGHVFSDDAAFTCNDWTSSEGEGSPRVGHSWPRGGGPGGGGFPGGGGPGGDMNSNNWMSALNEAGCAPGVSLIEMGPPDESNPTVGSGGGYGGFYCFALSP